MDYKIVKNQIVTIISHSEARIENGQHIIESLNILQDEILRAVSGEIIYIGNEKAN